ncbi:hypothetical protein PWR63_23450 [Paraburkholderia sp. A2WS-5]|uniref:hypothetical protein n=1 Tax=Paraburkholderia sp. A2WS-5 TaxID=3028372 RepID=UPI003B7CF3B2
MSNENKQPDERAAFEGKHVSLKQKGSKLLLTLELDAIEGAPAYAITPINPAVVRATAPQTTPTQLSTETVDKPVQMMSDAERDVLAERARQVSEEGWTPAHDDQHGDHEMSCAAGCYAMYTLSYPAGDPPPAWPWAADWWKPTTHRRNLIKAGALILAEIERIDRQGGSDAR